MITASLRATATAARLKPIVSLSFRPGVPYHPQTQGKIEAFIEHDNHHRYH